MNIVYRLMAQVSGSDAVTRVREALVRVYDADPRYGEVAHPAKAWIVWRLRETGAGVALESSEVTFLEEATITRDLQAALGAPVVPTGARAPDAAGPGDVVVAIGDRVMPPGLAWLVRSGGVVSRGERLEVDAVVGAQPRRSIVLGSLGGTVPSLRARFTGPVVELLELERVEVRRLLTGAKFEPVANEMRVTPSGWEIEVPELALPEGRRVELVFETRAVAGGRGTGTLHVEAGALSFTVGIDVRVSAKPRR